MGRGERAVTALMVCVIGCLVVLIAVAAVKVLWWLDRASSLALVLGTVAIGIGFWMAAFGALMALL